MIKHIVFWKLKDDNKKRNAETIKERLESLAGKVPGLLKIEVGLDYSKTEESADVALYSEFESKEALRLYTEHPDHKAILPFVKDIRTERRVVDFELNG